MKTSRFLWEYREGASSLHRAVGDCLRSSNLFQNYTIYQEYPVVRVNPIYSETSHHFDWVILELALVIECHGEQHYEVVDFSGKQEDGGISEFKRLRARDRAKKQAAIDVGWTYIEVPYTMKSKITDEWIYEAWKANRTEEPIQHDVVSITKVSLEQRDRARARNEKARAWRKQQYERQRARRKALDSGK